MAGNDDDKTVYGAAPPPARRPGHTPPTQPEDSPFGGWGSGVTQPPAGAAGGGDRTVMGQPGTPPNWTPPGAGWQGGPAPYPGTSGGWQAPPPYADPSRIGQAPAQGRGFFPDYAPRQDVRPAPAHRIPLADALRMRELGAGSSANPLLAAAASLLILLGRLRTGMVDLAVGPLMAHVTQQIDLFERNALSAGVHPHQALVAKYALSGTADDIVQNLPGGGDRGSWQQYSMVARFFHKRDSGVGFFQEAEKAMQAPAQNYNLLELMLVCLSLGFEGQFRTMPNGAAELSRIRSAIYESLRRVHPRPDEDVSPQWTPVVQDRRRFGALPLPAAAGVAAVVALAVFATFATLINRDAALAADGLRALHLGAPAVQIDRTPGAVFVADNPQLDRVRAAFGPEIAAGQVSVQAKGDYIAIRVGNLQLFDSGGVTVQDGFAALAGRIAEVLNGEPGPVLVEGHTDSVPLSGRGRFKDNYQLSQARADAVAEVVGSLLADPARLRTEGRGEDDPAADNATEQGRAENRRVEILLAREGTYDAPAVPEAAN
ncbi:MAG: type IVB secretion system protein IcmH/DotU [Paracoccus sp. (in: a-proteobacteria)]|nr:type IVB secretion system protein IcmH/DotU [Paracoccus sp. (in: a-proteobacteria)]